jgi:HSP20 family protein
MFDLVPVLRRHAGWDSPVSLFDRLFESFPLAGPSLSRETWIPAFDVRETEGEIIVTADVPGLKAEDVDIALHEGVLTVSGVKKHEKDEEKEGWRIVERSSGSFSRSFRLPVEVRADAVKAGYKDGVLTITLPKGEAAKARKIAVATE